MTCSTSARRETVYLANVLLAGSIASPVLRHHDYDKLHHAVRGYRDGCYGYQLSSYERTLLDGSEKRHGETRRGYPGTNFFGHARYFVADDLDDDPAALVACLGQKFKSIALWSETLIELLAENKGAASLAVVCTPRGGPFILGANDKVFNPETGKLVFANGVSATPNHSYAPAPLP